jgi:homoserine dehydrogenase
VCVVAAISARIRAKLAPWRAENPCSVGGVSESEVVRIGLLGCGNVGSALVDLVNERATAIAQRTGITLRIVKVAVRDTTRARSVNLPSGAVVADVNAVVDDSDVDLVVEVMGGIEPARAAITTALGKGKPVVTANKALLAEAGAELFRVADVAGVDLLFEAAVAGGIPFIRPLRESLRGESIRRVMGIVNGTTNFILTKMTEEGADYAAVLAEAQKLGFAEADPTADVEAFDAAAKCAVIASIAFAADVRAGDVHREGITSISAADIAVAKRLGYVIKLLAIAEREANTGELSVRVHPAMVPITHPLASVREAYNAVFVEGEAVGSLMFYGRGAGGDPTASAVLGDVIDAAVNLKKGTHAMLGSFARPKFTSINDTSSEYLLPLEVVDQPGVLHTITGVFAKNGVSIRTAEQEGIGENARLVFITHSAREAAVRQCLTDFTKLNVVKSSGAFIRVVGQ